MFFFCYPLLFDHMCILVIEVGFNQLMLADAIVASRESVFYTNCRECAAKN